jgi:Ca2+-binding RTX toxin-like protein
MHGSALGGDDADAAHGHAIRPGTPGVDPGTGSGASGASLMPGTAGADGQVASLSATSVLDAGGLIDPEALTRLSGDVRFAPSMLEPMASAIEGTATGQPNGVPAGLPGGEMQVSLVALPEPELPDLVLPPDNEPPEEDLGDIGEHETGGNGDDTLIGTDKDDQLDGGDGNDLIRGGNGNDSLIGGNGDDTAHGENGEDTIAGGNGNDSLTGGAGNDSVIGGADNDHLNGGSGEDDLNGGSGNDTVDGGTGQDTMTGETGNDRLVIDDLHDLTYEHDWGSDGGGIDTLVVADRFSHSLAESLPGLSPDGKATFVLGWEVGVHLPAGVEPYAQQVNAFIENVSLQGDADHDVLGDERANRLVGNDGDNRLYGGGGNDVLDGGRGRDVLDGGSGDDRFVLRLNEDGVDMIFDTSGSNVVRLAGAEAGKVGAALDGDDLHLTYDGREVGIIKGYVGHESNFDGLELDGGMREIADLLPKKDILDDYLPRPDQQGDDDADILRAGNDGDWLSGKGGNDTLIGGAGADRLEGGDGSDALQGGGGDDTYHFRPGQAGMDRISDSEGSNVAQIDGYAGQKLAAFMVGRDMWVTMDDKALFVVEGYGNHPESFAGIRAGEKMIDPHDLAA